MIYADYDYYTGTFGGTSVTPELWDGAALEACAYIDRITFDRIKLCPALPDAVKMAACAVAEIVIAERAARRSNMQTAGVKSYSNDGYSETLATAQSIAANFARLKLDAAKVYLPASHPLRYLGVN